MVMMDLVVCSRSTLGSQSFSASVTPWDKCSVHASLNTNTRSEQGCGRGQNCRTCSRGFVVQYLCGHESSSGFAYPFYFFYFFSEARAGMFIDSAGGSVVAAVGPFISFHESGTMLVNAQALWHALHRVASSTGSQTTRRVEESDACICNRV